MQLKTQFKSPKPIYAQCHTCFKRYDMIEWGVECPSCKNQEDKNKKKR